MARSANVAPPPPARPSRSPSRPCCACSPRTCPSSPRRCGRGGRRARCTARRGPTRRSSGRPQPAPTPIPPSTGWLPTCSARSAKRRRRGRSRCGPRSSWRSCGTPPSACTRSSPRSPTCGRRGAYARWSSSKPTSSRSKSTSPKTRPDLDIGAARAWLDAHVNLESTGLPPGADRRATAPTLERIDALVQLLGSPQDSYPEIHLTGTNGKTSVARMTSALLEASGLSVGVYTSPHLEEINERIVWNGEPVDDPTLALLLTRIADIESHLPDRPSYFEILTAAALTWFSDIAVDVAVIEVGVGGTWDATNVVDGRVAVVTNVSADHFEYLGPTR